MEHIRDVEDGPLPLPSLIAPERWAKAERITEGILRKVQPTHASEARRKKVVNYVQKLIKNSLGCEVFPYGSVPLKTYLPDGDIDLTVFGGINTEDDLANGMVSALEGADHNGAAEFVVKDIKLIRAEVKIVKCIIQNIVVDISINQIGGVCTLCFLEQVDRLIGKDHLFKRSIILIKAWCYYESRILGSHHGLISTYGLETLVLYIFHLFHTTLDGPLAVLYKFLDYFSKFGWENYCISLTGPVSISSLPDIVAERPENDGGGLLLSNDFLRCCTEAFSVPTRGVDSLFQKKHLNIVDPLIENNNLGRSVSKANFYRIRSAFAYGARKLGQILMLPDDDIVDKLQRFFSNTLERHEDSQRPDVQESGASVSVRGRPSLPFPPQLMLSLGKNSGSNVEVSASVKGRPFHAPHLYFTKSPSSNAEMNKEKISSKVSERLDDMNSVPDEFLAGGSTVSVSPKMIPFSEDNTGLESTNSLANLSGDYEGHFSCLQYARRFFEHGLGMPVPIPLPHSRFQTNLPWDAMRHPPHFKRNGVITNQPIYPMNPPLGMPGVAFASEDMPKPRGTGTYFPNMGPQANQPPQVYRPLPAKGRHQQLPLRSPRNNGRYAVMAESSTHDRSSHDLPPQFELPFDQSGMKAGTSDLELLNGLVTQPEGFVGFGPAGQVPPTSPLLERSIQQRLPSSSSSSTPVSPNLGMQRLNPVFSRDHDRVSARSLYRLKNEDDFPPLPV